MNRVYHLVLVFVFISFSSIPSWAGEWFLVGEHYHTTTDVDFSRDPDSHEPSDSYKAEGITELLERGAKLGLNAMIVTDHSSVATCFDSLFQNASNKVVLICGEEWTTKKSLHLGLFNPPVDGPTESYLPSHPERQRSKVDVQDEAREMIKSIHERARARMQTSLIVVNHPGFKMYQPEDSLGADAVEALVPEYELGPQSRMWWLQRLSEGNHLIALGGSDYHACQGWDCVKRGDFFRTLFSEPVNLVNAASTSPTDVIDGIAHGRVVALASAKYGKLRIELNASLGSQVYDMGDTIAGVAVGDTVHFRVRVTGTQGAYVVVYGLGDGGKHAYSILLEAETDQGDFTETLDVARTGRPQAVHVELFDSVDARGRPGGAPIAISNPIYF